MQIDFAGPINNGKEQELHILTFIDRFYKIFKRIVFFKKANTSKNKFIDNYVQFHGVPWSLRIDQARCLIENQVEIFYKKIIKI